MSAETINKLLENIFVSKKEKSGVVLTVNQLYQLALQKLPTLKKHFVIEFVKKQSESARFSAPAKRPRRFQTISHPRIGLYFLDYAEFHKDWAYHNKGCTGFLLAVENLTNRLFVYPSKGKSTSQWEQAVDNFVEQVKNVNVIYTDRDAVATSKTFREKINNLYGVRWFFMVKGSKSYLAERYIRYVKEKLSQALEIKQTKNWIQFVNNIVKEYNSERIEGTSFKRSTITTLNFNEFLNQRLKLNRHSALQKKIKLSNDATLLINSARIYSRFISKEWNKSIFKFDVGDKVYLARRADWKNQKTGLFFKTSHWGTFGPSVYTVVNRHLRATKNFKGYVPVYSLKEIGPEHFFYSTELRLAKNDPI
jgi:hypothetical protein